MYLLHVTSVKARLSGFAGNTENSPDNEKIIIFYGARIEIKQIVEEI